MLPLPGALPTVWGGRLMSCSRRRPPRPLPAFAGAASLAPLRASQAHWPPLALRGRVHPGRQGQGRLVRLSHVRRRPPSTESLTMSDAILVCGCVRCCLHRVRGDSCGYMATVAERRGDSCVTQSARAAEIRGAIPPQASKSWRQLRRRDDIDRSRDTSAHSWR